VKKGTIMSLNPTSLVNTPATSPTAYVPLNRQTKHRIEVPQDPQEILNLVKDLYEQASVPTFEEKAKAPYTKNVDADGLIYLEPNYNLNVEGARYQITDKGEVCVTPNPYIVDGTLDIKEPATDPKVIEEVEQLIAEAKPQEEIPKLSLEVGYQKVPEGGLDLVKKYIDGSHDLYSITADGAVSVAKFTGKKEQNFVAAQQIIKPGELPVLKDGEERPVGQALNEATATEEAKAPANGQVLNLEA
jgi:hypothetical protein